MSDSTFQCILPLVILAIVWFALFQIKKKSRQTPTQTLTLSTELSRQEIGEIVADALPRSLISSAFNWNMHAIRDELKISGNYLTDGQGCLVLLVTGIIPGFLLLIFTADEIELITMDFSFLEDSGLLKVTTEGPRAQQVTEKLIPKLEHKQRHFQWDEAVIAATTTKGDQIKLLSMKSHNDGQEDSDLQSNADKEIQAKMHREQAHGYLQKGDFLEAFHEGQKAIQLLPNSAEAHNELGVILDGLGRQTEAIAAYELALSLDPALTDARKNLEEASQENEEALQFVKSPEAKQAFELFCRVSSQATMNQTVNRYPLMTTTYFVKAVEEVIAKQVPENDRPLFAQRRAWLATAVELERAKGIGH